MIDACGSSDTMVVDIIIVATHLALTMFGCSAWLE